MVPQNAHGPIPEPVSVLLYMVKGLCRCDEVKDLKMGGFQDCPCNHKASYKRGGRNIRERDVTTKQRNCHTAGLGNGGRGYQLRNADSV